jgi:hypothetical protein
MASATPSLETVVAIIENARGSARGYNSTAETTEVGSILSEWADLPVSKQDKVRPSFVSKVFPLVFGDNAFVQGAENYELQRQVPWYFHFIAASIGEMLKLLGPPIAGLSPKSS